MKNEHIIDRRRVKLENIKNPDYIPFLGGRPKRSVIINKEDIINLGIALNTCKTIDEFLKII